MPLAPWCSQSIDVSAAPVCCGRAGSGFECLCAMHMPPLQQSIPSVCQAVAHIGAHSSATATRHTQAPIFPGAIGMVRDLFMFGVGRIPQLPSILKLHHGSKFVKRTLWSAAARRRFSAVSSYAKLSFSAALCGHAHSPFLRFLDLLPPRAANLFYAPHLHSI